MTLLVTGATGNVGRQVVDQLLKAGMPVRALSRRGADAGLPGEVEVVPGDLTRPGELAAALDGVDRVYLFPVAETAAEFVVKAQESGVQRIVTLSSLSVAGGVDNAIASRHRAVEQAVERSDLEWTHVRPGVFAANALGWAGSIRADNVVRVPFANAAQAPVHEADIAAVAVAALVEDGHAGKSYELTGPASISQVEQVRAIGDAIGREIRFEELTREQARELWIGHGMPEDVAATLLDYLAEAAERPETPLSTMDHSTARPTRTFAEWAIDHAGDFR